MAKAEILSVGTELLLGQILNTNSQFLSSGLAEIGIDCYFHTTVGDNKKNISACLQAALNRSDVVIITGGLGPTADDLTCETIAEFFSTPLILDSATLEKIAAFFEQRGIPMAQSNCKQALRPQGADILPNPRGTAPGIIWRLTGSLLSAAGVCHPERDRYLLTFPGVPAEMKSMWRETAAPFLARTFGPGVVWSLDLKHYGIGESTLAEKYAHLLDLSNPTVAPLAGTGECRLRVTAKAATEEQAMALAAPVIAEIREESKELLYGEGDDTLESAIGRLLVEQHFTVALAESCTGGLVSKRLTDIPGSSRYVKLNIVTYSNEAKAQLLNIDEKLLSTDGAVSAACAEAMAEGMHHISGCDIALSITGIAGPDGGSKDKPVGLVYFALSDRESTRSVKKVYPATLTRADIRFRAASDALNLLRLHLLGIAPSQA